MFSIGQQVVCIEDKYWRAHCGETTPVKGRIYTIREIEVHKEGVGLRFEEIVNAPFQYSDGLKECAFWRHAFRPVRKTDISIFTAMLTPVGSKVPA